MAAAMTMTKNENKHGVKRKQQAYSNGAKIISAKGSGIWRLSISVASSNRAGVARAGDIGEASENNISMAAKNMASMAAAAA